MNNINEGRSSASLLFQKIITLDDLNDFVDVKVYEINVNMEREEDEEGVSPDQIIRKLLSHVPSGELYFYECRIEIVGAGENDPRYNLYIPVSAEADADTMSSMGKWELLQFVPRIINDRMADGTRIVEWVGLEGV